MNEVEKILESLGSLNDNELFKVKKRLDECIFEARRKKEEEALAELKEVINKWDKEDIFFTVYGYDEDINLSETNIVILG